MLPDDATSSGGDIGAAAASAVAEGSTALFDLIVWHVNGGPAAGGSVAALKTLLDGLAPHAVLVLVQEPNEVSLFDTTEVPADFRTVSIPSPDADGCLLSFVSRSTV